jgi:hypothetical protein
VGDRSISQKKIEGRLDDLATPLDWPSSAGRLAARPMLLWPPTTTTSTPAINLFENASPNAKMARSIGRNLIGSLALAFSIDGHQRPQPLAYRSHTHSHST